MPTTAAPALTTSDALTGAERAVYNVLTDRAMTPAQIKRALPGQVPVGTVRAILAALLATGLVRTGTSATHPNTTAWARA